MSLIGRINALTSAVGSDIKALLASQGNLAALATSAKNTLVAAINEAARAKGQHGQYHPNTAWMESWYCVGHTSSTINGSTTLTANRLYGFVLVVPEPIMIDRLAINVTTAAAGSVRIGIFSTDANKEPSGLILDAGEVSCGTTGIKTFTVSQSLSPETYIVGIVSDAAPALQGIVTSSQTPFYGVPATLSLATTIIYASFVYAAMPPAFPAPVTGGTITSNFVYFRRSS